MADGVSRTLLPIMVIHREQRLLNVIITLLIKLSNQRFHGS